MQILPSTSFFEATTGHNPSYVWRNVLAGQQLLKEGCRWHIGTGHQVFVWTDPWLPDTQNPFFETAVDPELQDLTVTDLKLNGAWDITFLNYLFIPRDVELILSIPLIARPVEDKWQWVRETKGIYTMKSASKILQLQPASNSIAENSWKKLWKVRVPPKVLNYLAGCV